MQASTPSAFRLLMDGSRAFADIEARGMRIDVPYLDKMLQETGDKIKEMENQLRGDEVFTTWRKAYGVKADLGSRQQLANVVFNLMGVQAKSFTAKGAPKTDVEALEEVDAPFVRRWVTLEKLKKARGTYLLGIRRETVDGYLHAFFNLHLATTYRSSSSDPNFQNQPIRDPRQAKLIRRAFIPRDGFMLSEIDYGALEFRGAACFWKDAAMVAYASDSKLDIHRDMAAECYLLPIDQVTKAARGFAKNQFVFPTLYGSYYGNTSTNLWANIGRGNLTTVDGLGLYDHLRCKGISNPEQFREHIKRVEERFNERFLTWAQEKVNWWNLYLSRGWFPLATGFVCKGVYSYNNLMNTPIQGPSFHCLLWSLIRINEILKQRKMRSMIIGQIHDSIFGDVYIPERDDYLAICKQVMTVEVRRHWPWIITPLEIEAEGSEVSWFDKKPIPIP